MGIIYAIQGDTDRAIKILHDKLYGQWNHVISHINIILMLMYLENFGINVAEHIKPEIVEKATNKVHWGYDRLYDL